MRELFPHPTLKVWDVRNCIGHYLALPPRLMYLEVLPPLAIYLDVLPPPFILYLDVLPPPAIRYLDVLPPALKNFPLPRPAGTLGFNVKSPDPTIINKAFSTFLDGDNKNKKALEDLNKVRQQYFADIVKNAQKDGIINVRGLESMTTEEVWNTKLRKPDGDPVALINLKGFNEKDDPIELTDVPGTVDQITVYDKPTGRIGLKDYINADLAKQDNKLFQGFNKIIQKNAEYFANSLIDMVLKVQLNTKLKAKDIGDYNFEFALVTGFADYKQNNKDATKDVLKLEKAKFIPLHTILCGLANLAGNEKPYKMELDTAKKEKANAAKVFYQLSRDGVPILDLELRYKGDFKSMPQFFATITDEFQTQLKEKCLVTKPTKKPNETAILNKTLYAK